MNTAFIALSTLTVGGAISGVVMAIGEARFVAAQHAARNSWEHTGKAVAGWSDRWAWAHDKTADLPDAGSVVVNVVQHITNIVNVTNVRLGHVVLGSAGDRSRTAVGPSTASAPRVIPGHVVSALPSTVPVTRDAVGALTGAVTRGRR